MLRSAGSQPKETKTNLGYLLEKLSKKEASSKDKAEEITAQTLESLARFKTESLSSLNNSSSIWQ